MSIAHVPGVDNNETYEETRNAIDDTEWSLTSKFFDAIKRAYLEMSVDLFASGTDHTIAIYVSKSPDLEAYAESGSLLLNIRYILSTCAAYRTNP